MYDEGRGCQCCICRTSSVLPRSCNELALTPRPTDGVDTVQYSQVRWPHESEHSLSTSALCSMTVELIPCGRQSVTTPATTLHWVVQFARQNPFARHN